MGLFFALPYRAQTPSFGWVPGFLNPPEADKSRCHAQILIFEIRNVFLRLIFSHPLTLNKNDSSQQLTSPPEYRRSYCVDFSAHIARFGIKSMKFFPIPSRLEHLLDIESNPKEHLHILSPDKTMLVAYLSSQKHIHKVCHQ